MSITSLISVSLLFLISSGCLVTTQQKALDDKSQYVRSQNEELMKQADIIFNKPQRPPWDMLHLITITTTPPGAIIEVDDDRLGNAPLTIGVYGTRSGKFIDDIKIRAIPTAEMEKSLKQYEYYRKSMAEKRFYGASLSGFDRIPRNIHIEIEKGYASGSLYDANIKIDVFNK